MHRTSSATPLDKIVVEIDPSGMLSHVWLRKNIQEVTKNDNDTSYVAYEADEVYLTIPGVCSIESITPMFETLWMQTENSESTINERVTALEEKMNSAMISIAANTLEIATK